LDLKKRRKIKLYPVAPTTKTNVLPLAIIKLRLLLSIQKSQLQFLGDILGTFCFLPSPAFEIARLVQCCVLTS
jgi:hypothetical protein